MRYTLYAVFAVLAFAVVGCDFLTPGSPSYAGVVVDAETGEPVEGILMSLKIGGTGFGPPVTISETLTDAAGKFSLRDPKRRSEGGTVLYVNSPGYIGDQPSPYNPSYTSGPVDYSPGNRRDIRVELGRSSN